MLPQWSLFGFVMFLFRCFLVCVTTKPNPPPDIIVTGYLGFHNVIVIRVILEQVTWYDARAICEAAGFGTLDGTTGVNITTSMVAAALHEANISTSTSVWTGNHRSNVTSDEWSFVDSNDNCSTTSLTFDTPDVGGHHCAVNRYPGNRDIPALEYQNCSNRFPFVCVELTSTETSFTEYTGFSFVTVPSNTTIRTSTEVFATCQAGCADNGFCISFSHDIETNACRHVMADFGFQRRQYVITYLDDVSDYTKVGRNVTIIANSTYASVTEVSQAFDCVDSSLSSTTSASMTTVSTSTSTAPTSTSTAPTSTSTATTSTSTATTSTEGVSQGTRSHGSTTFHSTTSGTVSSSIVTSTSTLTTSMVPSTTSTTTPSATSATTTDRTLCMCDYLCENRAPLNETELEELLEDMVRNLTVAKKETFLFKSTLVCMQDDRESSRAMGLVASIVMCVVFAPIVISDSYKLKELFLPRHS